MNTGLSLGTEIHAKDLGDAPSGSLSVEQLLQYIEEIYHEPPWRTRADREADYYDSNQYSSALLQQMRERGLPPIVINLIAPTINAVLGLEAKTRTDFIAMSDDGKNEDFADALTQELRTAERMTKADMASGAAFGKQIKVGLGWVNINQRELNPFGYPLVAEEVDRREIWWDYTDETPFLEKSRYLVRKKWYSASVLELIFKDHAQWIRGAASGMDVMHLGNLDKAEALYQDFLQERGWYWADDEWRNTFYKQLCLFEVWYRTYGWGTVMRLPGNNVQEFDPKNPAHQEVARTGLVEIKQAIIPRMRLSYWVGPHRLRDVPTPLPHNEFPYTPFWGYREDRTRVPYGMIRAMVPLQDEVNARRAKMMWQLSANRVIVEQDAVDDHEAVRNEIARPDAYVKIKRTTGKRDPIFKIEEHQGLNAQQYNAYVDSAERLKEVSSMLNETLGKASTADSGVAISQLVDQATQTLAGLMDNYRDSRIRVGEHLLALRRKHIGDKEHPVQVDKADGSKKDVILNEITTDKATGMLYRNNDVMQLKTYVVVGDISESATYQQQNFRAISEVVQALPENLQGLVLDMWVEASSVPNKKQFLERIRGALGINAQPDPSEMTEEEKAQYQAMMENEQKQAEMIEQMEQMQIRLQELEIEKGEVEVDKGLAEVDQIDAQTERELTQADLDRAKAAETRISVGLPTDEGSEFRIPGADPDLVPKSDLEAA